MASRRSRMLRKMKEEIVARYGKRAGGGGDACCAYRSSCFFDFDVLSLRMTVILLAILPKGIFILLDEWVRKIIRKIYMQICM